MMTNGVGKSCDLIQTLPIAGAALTYRDIYRKAAERGTSVYLPFLQSVPTSDHKMCVWVRKSGACWRGWIPRRLWSSFCPSAGNLHTGEVSCGWSLWLSAWKGGHKPGCAALCRSEASSHLKAHNGGSFTGKNRWWPSLISHVKMFVILCLSLGFCVQTLDEKAELVHTYVQEHLTENSQACFCMWCFSNCLLGISHLSGIKGEEYQYF